MKKPSPVQTPTPSAEKRAAPLRMLAPKTRNPIVQAAAKRAGTSAAGKHEVSKGGQRRAGKLAVQREVSSATEINVNLSF